MNLQAAGDVAPGIGRAERRRSAPRMRATVAVEHISLTTVEHAIGVARGDDEGAGDVPSPVRRCLDCRRSAERMDAAIAVKGPAAGSVLTKHDGTGDVESAPVGCGRGIQIQSAEGMNPAVAIERHAAGRARCGMGRRGHLELNQAGKEEGGHQRRVCLPGMRHGPVADCIGWGVSKPPSLHSQRMSSVAVIGAGYVGLTTAVCLADLGHRVTGVDIDKTKVTRLRAGEPTIYEPGLEDLVAANVKAGRLSFATELKAPVAAAGAVFIAVGTPSRRGDGHADLSYVYAAPTRSSSNRRPNASPAR